MKKEIESGLFALLRLGLCTAKAEDTALSDFAELTRKDWVGIRTMGDKQGVSAITFDGLNILITHYGRERVCPKIAPVWWQTFVYDWIGLAHHMEFLNLKQQEVMEDMAAKWRAEGCRMMVFKGQANAVLYPQPLHRSVGDIDCYLFENYARGNEVAREIGAEVDESWYKHSVISYRGETFENHQFFVHTRDGKRSKMLEQELEHVLHELSSQSADAIMFPPVQWTAMFLTYHACSHFISEGLRLKQLLDWAMFLNAHQGEVDWPQFYAFCSRHHLRRFVDAVTAISVTHLGIKMTHPAVTTESPYAEKILQSALCDDDYVFATGSGWHNRWHLVKNLWRYRWKYRDIYEMSPLRQLWYYASGYLFRTE